MNTFKNGLSPDKNFQSVKNHQDVESFTFVDDGIYPNSRLPLVIYHQVFNTNSNANPEIIEGVFHDNGWKHAWRNGLYNIHHYHSSAHEVLGIYRGWVKAQFGGPKGKIIKAGAGDVIVVPAGVAHKNTRQSSDFKTIGAYPNGQNWDMNYGKPGERPQSDRNIRNVPMPKSDPVFGISGPLLTLWTRSA